MAKPLIYLAAKIHRIHFIYHLAKEVRTNWGLDVISAWHDGKILDDINEPACRAGWEMNRAQVLGADLLLAYGKKEDALNGTMIEIGMAVGRNIPIYLVGAYPWATWTSLNNVKKFDALPQARDAIRKDFSL
jgi:nucleoside 2-deoxyribosyltransferase